MKIDLSEIRNQITEFGIVGVEKYHGGMLYFDADEFLSVSDSQSDPPATHLRLTTSTWLHRLPAGMATTVMSAVVQAKKAKVSK